MTMRRLAAVLLVQITLALALGAAAFAHVPLASTTSEI